MRHEVKTSPTNHENPAVGVAANAGFSIAPSLELSRRQFRKERIEALASPSGGYSREILASMGISWPPKTGWKRDLIASDRPLPRINTMFATNGARAHDHATYIAAPPRRGFVCGTPHMPGPTSHSPTYSGHDLEYLSPC